MRTISQRENPGGMKMFLVGGHPLDSVSPFMGEKSWAKKMSFAPIGAFNSLKYSTVL